VDDTTEPGLEQVYRDYLAVLDARRLDELDRFVHDRLTYNGQAWSREDYRSRLAEDVRTIPDLRYDVELLVPGADHVACRIRFLCTPQGDFRGLPTKGRRLSFVEHVFYRFRAARIEEVWSVIDTDAVRRQLADGG
jgi:predicted ester cyclase